MNNDKLLYDKQNKSFKIKIFKLISKSINLKLKSYMMLLTIDIII